MGYTHYWYRPRELNEEKWRAFMEDVTAILDTTETPLAGGLGEGKPEVSSEGFSLNGVGPRDDHETFMIYRKFHRNPMDHEKAKRLIFDCTKTAYKPYDEVVTACLIAFKHHFGDDVRVSSDGEYLGDWTQGATLYERATGRPAADPTIGGDDPENAVG